MFQHTYATILPQESGEPTEVEHKMVTCYPAHAESILMIWQSQRQEDGVKFRLIESIPFTGDEKKLQWRLVSRVSSLFVAHLH